MDNIIKTKDKNETSKIKSIKNNFKTNMREKDINIEKFITRNQLNKIVELKNNMNSDNIVLDESVKQIEIQRIHKETEQLNGLILFLENNLHSKIVNLLAQEHNLNNINKDGFIQDIPESLNMIIKSNKPISSDPVLNSYIKNLIIADKIDFSLFHYGSATDIFSLINESFITQSQLIVKKDDMEGIDSKDSIIKTSSKLSNDYILINKKTYTTYNDNTLLKLKNLEKKKELNYYDSINNTEINHMLNNTYKGILNKMFPHSKISNNKFSVNICGKHYKFMEVIDILRNIKGDPDKSKFKEEIKKYLDEKFVKQYSEIFQYYYLHYLAFDYMKNTKPKIRINTKIILKNTLKQIKIYLEIIKNILIDVIKNKSTETDSNINIENYIKEEYDRELRGKYVSGFLLSTLHNFHRKDKYNIQAKYINNPVHRKNIDKIQNIDKNIEECTIYLYKDKEDSRPHITKIVSEKLIEKVEASENIRMILTKKQLENLHNIYNFFFKGIVQAIRKIINNYEISQQKYLYILDLLIINDKQKYEYLKEKKIAKEFKLYLKSENLQTDVNIIVSSKVYFSKIIFELNNKLLRLIKEDNDLSDKYNRFITEYSLWIIYIINHISSYPNDSKQIYHFEKILQMFMNEKDIKKWYNSCVKNNLCYWLPVYYKGNSQYSFFIDLITNKKSYKIKSNDLIIVKYKNSKIKKSDDEITSWNNNTFNIIVDDHYNRISTFIKQYKKCNSPLDMNDFEVIKSLITRCDKKKKNYDKIIKDKIELVHKFNKLTTISEEIKRLNKELALSEEVEHDCKHLISYHQIIKEIVKIKYPFKVDNSNNLTNLNIKVRQYQQNLYEQIPKQSII